MTLSGKADRLSKKLFCLRAWFTELYCVLKIKEKIGLLFRHKIKHRFVLNLSRLVNKEWTMYCCEQ